MSMQQQQQNYRTAVRACYLLRSKAPTRKGRTYVGFTVDPERRIRQHNGEIVSGAKSTRSGRPWEMLMVVSGFHSKVRTPPRGRGFRPSRTGPPPHRARGRASRSRPRGT